ncbi:MAG: tetratricopeptide repeat protein [Cyanobacteria bacterium J06638_20]
MASIDDASQELPSVTEEMRSLQFFTDRHNFVRLLAECLNDAPAPEQIQVLHGEGGNGKSLLLRYLRTQCCKWLSPQTWQQVKALPDARLAEYITGLKPGNYVPVPVALLDFGSAGLGVESSRDPFYGLLMLRRALGESAGNLNQRLRFPLYDFACVWYLHQKGKSPEEIKALFPLGEAAGMVSTLIDVVSQNAAGAIANALFSFFAGDLGNRFTVYLAKVGLEKERVQQICQMELDKELVFELPRLLGDDLNAAMVQKEAPPRIVLFFDTHEAFWGHERQQPTAKSFERDAWVRKLLRRLDLTQGIVAIVAGRDVPRWAEAKAVAPKTDIPAEYLKTQRVGHLTEADGAEYLQKVGIGDVALAQQLLAVAQVAPNEVHPLYLGLCADVVLSARERDEILAADDFADLPDLTDKAEQLIERLLRYVTPETRYAIEALSACRCFDYDLYTTLGNSLPGCYQPLRPHFDALIRFSFVWRNTQGGYCIHDLLRRLEDERESPITRKAHQVLLNHFQEHESIEVLYHLNRLDWRQGVEKWLDVFDEALQYSRYGLCRNLLDLRNDLLIRSDFMMGYVSEFEGQYFATLSQHRAAEQEFREAIAAYNGAFKSAPDDVGALNNKGNTLAKLGGLQADLSQHREALNSYQQAIAAYDVALQCVPRFVQALNNKGNTLRSLGDLQVGLSQHREALSSYQRALAVCGNTLQHAPNDVEMLNNKGSILQRLGDLQANLSQHSDALSSYQQAIAAYDGALRHSPNNVYAFNNKGNTLARLANLQASLSQHSDALSSYEQAIAAYDETLQLAPDYVAALNNRGLTLRCLGDLQFGLLRHKEALSSYQQAIVAYDSALQLAPDYVSALNNRGWTLQSLGKLQSSLSQHNDALDLYQQAIVAYNEALKRVPEDCCTLNNKGLTLLSLGDLQADLSQYSNALSSYQQAIVSYNAALQHAPDYIDALNNKGCTLQHLGDLQVNLYQYGNALSSYQQAITVYDAVLQHAPNHVYTLNNKGMLLFSLGRLQLDQDDQDVAVQNFWEAFTCFSHSLSLAPNDASIQEYWRMLRQVFEATGSEIGEDKG